MKASRWRLKSLVNIISTTTAFLGALPQHCTTKLNTIARILIREQTLQLASSIWSEYFMNNTPVYN